MAHFIEINLHVPAESHLSHKRLLVKASAKLKDATKFKLPSVYFCLD